MPMSPTLPPSEPETAPPVGDPPESVAGAPAAPRPAPPAVSHRRVPILIWIVVAMALLFGAWGAWRTLAPGAGDVHARLSASEQAGQRLQAEMSELQQTVATLTRSDQISRDANRDLQGALAEREEEIAGLRADVAFYERLVGSTSQRHGLTVHALRMAPQSGSAWEFQTTLTQNLNRGAVSSGRLSLSIEGTMAGKRRVLAWDDLRQGDKTEGTPFSFKYFQQVKGDVFLPDGFEPVRVTVRLQPRSGAAVSESFSWSDVTGPVNPTANGVAGS